MAVEPIQNNSARVGIVPSITKGALIGATIGYSSKFFLPLTKEEQSTDEYIKIKKRIEYEKTAYNPRTEKLINSIKSKENLTVAEDEFVKMFDGLQNGDKLKISTIKRAFKNVKTKSPNEIFEFKRICMASSDIANKTAKTCQKAYDVITKLTRPSSAFILAGAVTGVGVSLANRLLKVDVDY